MQTLATLLMLPVIAGIGFLSRKTNYVRAEAFSYLPELMLRVCYPLMILSSLMQTDLVSISGPSLTAVLITAGLTLALYLVGKFAFRRAAPERRPLYLFNLAIGNVVYVTIPVMNVLFGPEGVVITMLCTTTQDIFMWSLFHFEFRQSGSRSFVKSLANPCFLALVVGAVLSLLHVPFPAWMEFASRLAAMTSPLGMLFIGSVLAGCGAREIFTKPAFFTAALKVLVVPVLACAVFFLISRDSYLTSVMTLYFASPCALITSVWAKEYGKDQHTAAGSVLISTLIFFCGVILYTLLR